MSNQTVNQLPDQPCVNVAVKLDALYLDLPRAMVEPSADFSRLPWCNGKRDFNPDNANISANIATGPFQDRNFFLSKGVYLHWALPDALTKAQEQRTEEGQLRFPAVPNRWLITRTQDGVSKQWVVESDYLYPYPDDCEASSKQPNAVCIPYHPQWAYQNNKPPFRYLGRTLPLETWLQNSSEGNEYLDTLTALGYEHTLAASKESFAYMEPTFSAFFPNCFSVFGFHDDVEVSDDLSYQVMGWYSRPEQDFLRQFIKTQCIDANATDVGQALNWNINTEAASKTENPLRIPDTMRCFAQLHFATNTVSESSPEILKNLSITLGNTETEALAAHIARRITETPDSVNEAEVNKIEEQLQAIEIHSQLYHRQLDIAANFRRIRHNEGFTASSGGIIWDINSAESVVTQSTSTSTSKIQSPSFTAELPIAIASQLNELNLLQQEYQRQRSRIKTLQSQLFSMWYKYMICCYPPFDEVARNYPDINAVMDFIEDSAIKPLQQALQTTGQVLVDASGLMQLSQAVVSTPENQRSSLAQQLFTAWSDVTNILKANNAVLTPKPAPNFWQTNDPQVLITGDIAKATDRHAQAAATDCQVLSVALSYKRPVATQFALKNWTKQPWNPITLDWEVEVLPVLSDSNQTSANTHYHPSYIERNYQLPEQASDLQINADYATFVESGNVYQGKTLLSAHASPLMQEKLNSFIERNKESSSDDSLLKMAKQALSILEDTHCQSQSLGGFNLSHLMQQQIRQMNIADPLAFSNPAQYQNYQKFTDRVQQLVGMSGIASPLTDCSFCPIRSGKLLITRLRLVDTFGQYQELPLNTIESCQLLSDPNNDQVFHLPPRFSQSARLNFRWLAATHNKEQTFLPEMNSHPATTPVCGWILNNNLDGSVMFYSQSGEALGSIDQNGSWVWAPGSKHSLEVMDGLAPGLANPWLNQVAKWLLNRAQLHKTASQSTGNSLIANFIASVNSALSNVEPESYAAHQGLALLMGRPLAVVRASLALELEGGPAINQSWTAFRSTMANGVVDTAGIDDVSFPIRLGEYQQLNDGLVGYWLEQNGTIEHASFYSPQSDDGDLPDIEGHNNKPLNITQSISEVPSTVTMLFDPRAKVHATCGVLPCKSLSIPSEQFANALEVINITFLVAPVIFNHQSPCLPLPKEPGMQWFWLEKQHSEADSWQTTKHITRPKTDAFFSLNSTLNEGWLQLTPHSNDS